ncbi:Scramblase-domain-containing protein [Boletus edulis]|nr:Scramblase-domain-containing protein [Boletus edulis]
MAAFVTGYRLFPRQFCTPLAQQCRLYALSRFPIRTTGFGRNPKGSLSRRSQSDPPSEDRRWTSSDYEEKPSEEDSQRWRQSTVVHPTADPDAGLRHLLVNNDELIVTRQLEMLNIFMGFEQSNRYVITNLAGDSLGYIVEEPRGFLSMFARQVFRTHRPFRALVMDLEGSPVLWIRRPFSWINSRMFVQSPRDYHAPGEPVLDTFAEVQQEWHLWRRRYNLFLRATPHRVLTTLGSDPQPEPTTPEVHFNQFARVDQGLWAWHFILRDAQGEGIASINRAFRGFGREIFTDTGQYTVSFRAPDEQVYSSSQSSERMFHKAGVVRNLAFNERALILATAINIDYDYFSRHSEGGGFGFGWSSGE